MCPDGAVVKQLTQLFAEQPCGGASPFRASLIMRTPEIPVVEKEATEHGFHEGNIARKREGRGMDNSQVKKRKPFSLLKRRLKKILVRRDRDRGLPKDPQDLVK